MLATALTLSAFAIGALAQSSTSTPRPTATTAETTITALFGTMTSGFAGSIVSANPCDTTLALQCTDTLQPLCRAASDITITVTLGPTAYEVAYATETLGADASISQSCDLDGPSGSFTQAVCTASVSFSVAGTETATSTVTTLTDPTDFIYAQVPITAGASKLPSAGATCSESSTETANAAAATVLSDVYKVLVPAGAVIAGALF